MPVIGGDGLQQWQRFWAVMTVFFFLAALFWLKNVPRGTPEANLGASALFLMAFSAVGSALLPRLPLAGGFLAGAAAYAVLGLLFSLGFVALRSPSPADVLSDPITRYNFVWVALTWPLHLLGLFGGLDFLFT